VHAEHAWVVVFVVLANAGLIVGMWLGHGQLGDDGPGGRLTALGQVTALLGTYAVLLELLLMSRLRWLERYAGFDRLTVWHRWTGFAALWLLAGHVAFTTLGYAAGSDVSVWAQTVDFVQHYPDVLMAFVAMALLVAVAVTSARAARRRLDRETWYFIHLYAYLAIALGFAHQLAVGSDFTDDPLARAYWIVLTAGAVGTVLVSRLAQPVAFNLRHRLRVAAVTEEAPGVVSLRITGRDLGSIDVRPGQFFLWRFLTRDGWWRAHPFSLSAANRGHDLRITIKALGDHTARLQRLRPGTAVVAEGPYGAFTADKVTGRPRLLVAGGIGITPLRALLEELSVDGTPTTLLYRVASEDELVFRDELARAAALPSVAVHLIVDGRVGDDDTDALGVPALRALVPGIADHDAFVCGPTGMMDAVARRLRALGVPRDRIHLERFDY